MNGWAKIAGALTVVAGVVFILAVALAISDGCDFGDYRLECFAYNDYFTYLTLLAGLIGAVAGLVAICGGIGKNISAASVLGISVAAFSLILIVVPYLDDVSSLSWDNMEVTLAIIFLLLAAVEVICGAKLKMFGVAITAVILAFCVDAAYLLDLYEGMLFILLGAVIVILAGCTLFRSAKALNNTSEVIVEEAEEKEAEKLVLTPVSAPVAAKPYVAPEPNEEAAPAKPAEESKPVVAEEAKAVSAAVAAVAAEEAQPAPVQEESEDDKLLRKGEEVANVGEDRANEMSDYEIVASAGDEEPEVEVVDNEPDFSDYDLGLEPDTPAGFVRRACWNKGLRCRLGYGPHAIPIAFVKSKVAVYIDGDVVDNSKDEELKASSWVVLHFKEFDITDGEEQAVIINDIVKENLRAMKKPKAKKAKKKR